jgi:hypothetical protein
MYIHNYPLEISITAFYDTNNRRGGKTNGTYGTHNKKGTQVLGLETSTEDLICVWPCIIIVGKVIWNTN